MDKYVAMTPAVYVGNGVKVNEEDIFMPQPTYTLSVDNVVDVLVSVKGKVAKTSIFEEQEEGHLLEFFCLKAGEIIEINGTEYTVPDVSELTIVNTNEPVNTTVYKWTLPETAEVITIPFNKLTGNANMFYAGLCVLNEGATIQLVSFNDLTDAMLSQTEARALSAALRFAGNGPKVSVDESLLVAGGNATVWFPDLYYAFALCEVSQQSLIDHLCQEIEWRNGLIQNRFARFSFAFYKGSGVINFDKLPFAQNKAMGYLMWSFDYMCYKHNGVTSAKLLQGDFSYAFYKSTIQTMIFGEISGKVDFSYAFFGCTQLEDCTYKSNGVTTYIDGARKSNLSYMFAETNLTSTHAWFTSGNYAYAENREGFYYNCTKLEVITNVEFGKTPGDNISKMFGLSLDNWDTDCVCSGVSCPVSGDPAKATDMSYLFCNRMSLTFAKDLPDKVFYHVGNLSYAFYRCIKLFDGKDLRFDAMPKVVDASYAFYENRMKSFTIIELEPNRNLKDTSHMFDFCSYLKTVKGIYAPEIDYCAYMFYNCNNLQEFEAHDANASPNYIAGYHDTSVGSGISGRLIHGFSGFAKNCYSATKITLGKAGGTFRADNAFENCIGILSTGISSQLSMSVLEDAGTLIVDWSNCTSINNAFVMGAMIGSQVGAAARVHTIDFSDNPFNTEKLNAYECTSGFIFDGIIGLTTTSARSVLANVYKTISSSEGYEKSYPYAAIDIKCTGNEATYTFGSRLPNTGDLISHKKNGVELVENCVFGDAGTSGAYLFKDLPLIWIIDCPMPYGNLKETFANCPKLEDVKFRSLYAMNTAEGALDNSPSLGILDFSECTFIEDEGSTVTFADTVLSILTQSENITAENITVRVPAEIASEINFNLTFKALQNAGKFGPIASM